MCALSLLSSATVVDFSLFSLQVFTDGPRGHPDRAQHRHQSFINASSVASKDLPHPLLVGKARHAEIAAQAVKKVARARSKATTGTPCVVLSLRLCTVGGAGCGVTRARRLLHACAALCCTAVSSWLSLLSNCNNNRAGRAIMSYPTNDSSQWERPQVESLVLAPRRRSIIREEQEDGNFEEKTAPLERWTQVQCATPDRGKVQAANSSRELL